jgi:hypothetical protein
MAKKICENCRFYCYAKVVNVRVCKRYPPNEKGLFSKPFDQWESCGEFVSLAGVEEE